MSTDLVVTLPVTGQELDLNLPDETLALLFDQIRELESEAKVCRDAISEELIRRMDRNASWTVRGGGFKVSAPSPAPKTEYDASALNVALKQLVSEGLISNDAWDAAIVPVVTLKPHVAKLNALKKLGGRVREVIEGCETQVERSRRVTVAMDRS